MVTAKQKEKQALERLRQKLPILDENAKFFYSEISNQHYLSEGIFYGIIGSTFSGCALFIVHHHFGINGILVCSLISCVGLAIKSWLTYKKMKKGKALYDDNIHWRNIIYNYLKNKGVK